MTKIGPHTKKLDTPNDTRSFCRSQGYGVIQIWANNPRSRAVKILSEDPAFDDGQRDVDIVVHSPYPVHFLPPDHAKEKDIKFFQDMAEHCRVSGYQYLVAHLGATKDRAATDVIQSARDFWDEMGITETLRRCNVKLLIENVAAKYETNQDLNNYLKIIDGHRDVLGWCLDFAHSNAAGVCYDVVQDLLKDPDRRPEIIHCNYPGSLFGSSRDRHGWFYKDHTPVDDEVKKLWRNTVRVAASAEIPLVLEGSSDPGDHHEEFEAIQKLVETEIED